VEEALAGCDEPAQRARMLHLRGHIERLAGDLRAGVALLVEAAELADPDDAVTMLVEAAHGAVNAGDPGTALDVATRARALAREDGGAADFRAGFALGYALVTAGRAGEAGPHLDRALRLLDALEPEPSDLIRGTIAAALLDRATDG